MQKFGKQNKHFMLNTKNIRYHIYPKFRVLQCKEICYSDINVY